MMGCFPPVFNQGWDMQGEAVGNNRDLEEE
jgi:hypothetical protein